MASERPTTGDAETEATASRSPEEHPLPPGPGGYPLVGNSVSLVRDPFGFFDTLAEYGDVVRYSALGREFTALLHPDYVQRVLVEEPDRFERFLFSDSGFDFAPEGILFNYGERGDRQRKLMQPAFTMDRIRSYAATMVEYAERTGEQWDDGQVVNLNRDLSKLTLRILAKALFDVEVDPTEDETIVRAARTINELGDTQGASVILPDWVPTPTKRRYRKTMDDYRERVTELVAQRRGVEEDGDDLLSILLNAEAGGDSLSQREVQDNLITFLFAGHETSSLALTYTFMLLAGHDDVATKLRAELANELDGTPTFSDVPRLEYTEKVLKESMRLYPPAFAIWREATEPAVIGGYRIPEGMLLTLPQFRLHEDERFYDDPEQFRPERWTDDFEVDLPEYAYFPFGGGPRHCIGMRFAMLEMKLIVAVLARRFEMELLSDSDPELAPMVTLQPREDVRVRVHER